jgi:hypothetical protein
MRRTPLKRVSNKLARELHCFNHYTKPAYLATHPFCEICGSDYGVTIHHKMRRGKYLNDSTTFMTVCIIHHNWIEDHKREAREKGYILYK